MIGPVDGHLIKTDDDMDASLDSRIADIVDHFWGIKALRPLQGDAIRAGIAQRDSLVVMPTGGGKSLCYQVPPLLADRTDIVISPLIALMKDQVDGLQACGYPAAAIHSNLSRDEKRHIMDELTAGKYRLLFVSPERLVMPGFLRLIDQLNIRSFAIDEAHCISHWGHDFRPEYRQLATLRDRLGKDVSLHAFTATATPRVREDIAAQLQLQDPTTLVGCFDRPNLAYRVVQRVDAIRQVADVIQRHPDEAIIVYCISRKDTESLASALRSYSIDAKAYHAGMEPEDRRATQDAFTEERLNVVVATVAFGMGIDRSNVRCVIHAAMPKSIEHYQQETGRAGRDGLEAECVLLYSAADFMKWRDLMSYAHANGGSDDGDSLDAQIEMLSHMSNFASSPSCRHRGLSRYFGQAYEEDNCGACDVCLDEVDILPDSTVIAQKILSCIARMGQRFGVTMVVQVLRGADTDGVRRRGFESLSTYGILSGYPESTLKSFVYQLLDQDLLNRSGDDRPVIALSDRAVAVLRGDEEARLIEPTRAKRKRTKVDGVSWAGVDRGLFEELRAMRRDIADERKVPAYVVFSDATLRDLARIRPTQEPTFATVHGVGAKKLADLAPVFIEVIRDYCDTNALDTNVNG